MLRAAVLSCALLAPLGGPAPSVGYKLTPTALPSPQLVTYRHLLRYAGPGDARALYGIAYRESRFQPDARNRRSGAAGLWQFMPQTWEHARRGAGLPASASPYNPDQAARAAAWLWQQPNGPSAWGAR